MLDGRYIENKNADLTVRMSLDDLASIGICDKKMQNVVKEGFITHFLSLGDVCLTFRLCLH
jgi:hypothetical protein